MMRHRVKVATLLVFILLFGLLASAQAQEATPEVTPEVTQEASPVPEVTQEPSPEATEEPATQAPPTAAPTGTTHVVQPGENLYRISLRYGTSISALAQANGIVNPSLIFVGQSLTIPGTAPAPVVTATPPPVPSPTPTVESVYTVIPGDTLIRIAIRFRTTTAALLGANNIPNPNIIFVGQRLNIPGIAAPATPEPQPPTTPMGDAGFDYGVQVFAIGQDANTLAAQVSQLGVSWVKVEVNWKDLEPAQGAINFDLLDPVVAALEANDLQILFTVSSAPAWARSSVDEDGPPDNFDTFGTFVGALAQRYAGRVAAYEIWNEPNLRREWNSNIYPIRADHYVNLLSKAYAAIKSADADAKVISAGLAPTGFNDGVNAINDRVFLQDMYSNKVFDFSDAVGAHPGGWANPPQSTCCTAAEGVLTHFNDRSFYFLDTLNDYRQIMLRNSAGNTPIWVTKFGWGTSADTDAPGQANVFLTYTSLTEQATFDASAFEVAADLGFVGPMFLYNLNGCLSQADGFETCYYSLIGPDGTARPAFAAVQNLEKSSTSDEANTPEATPEATG